MLLSIVMVIAGFILLIYGADRFVSGASATAFRLGVSTLIIGLVVVGFGTSLPEMIVAATAAFDGNSDLGLGNAIGSNIANIGLVLALSAVLVPITVASRALHRELPLLLLISFASLLFIFDGGLSVVDGVYMLGMILLVLLWMGTQSSIGDAADPLTGEMESEIPQEMTLPWAIFWLLIGGALVIGGSKLLVTGAVDIAMAVGVSNLVIGLTVVAIGTSLPELAAAVASALKREPDLIVGNIIGSNMFNLLAVVAMPALIAPGPIQDQMIFTRDYPLMLVLTVVLFVVGYGLFGRRGQITRLEGGLLLVAYLGYMVALYLTAQPSLEAVTP